MKASAATREGQGKWHFIHPFTLPAVLLLAAGVTLSIAGCNRAPSSTSPAPPTENSTVQGGILSKNVPVSGQVFIVTKGGENFKLGLVHVAIAEDSAFESFKKSLADDINKKLAGNKATIDAALPDYNAAKAKFDAALPDYQNANSALQSALNANGINYLSTMNEVDSITPDVAANIVALDKARANAGAKLQSLYSDASDKYSAILSAKQSASEAQASSLDAVIEAFPALADTKTDADGRFTLSVPAGKDYKIVAEASREVGDDTEHYHWIVDVDLNNANDGLSVMLSNDNLVDSVDLSIDTSLTSAQVDDMPSMDIKTEPTAYVFKDSSYNVIQPSGVTDASSSSATVPSSTPAPTTPVWTPPSQLPAKDNWTWVTGDKTYQNVVISSVNTSDNTVTITHSLGVARLPMESMPAEIQKALNYIPGTPVPAPANTSDQ